MKTSEQVQQTLSDIPSAPTTSATQLFPEQHAASFLASATTRYIEGMRTAFGNVLYGGDIELIEIAKILNVNIIVHKHLGYSLQSGLMVETNPPIGPKGTPTIQLLLASRHYQIYLPTAASDKVRIINVPGDGNCLFHACIRAKKLLTANGNLAAATSTIAEVAQLRRQVCDGLQELQAAIVRGDLVERDSIDGGVKLTQDNNPIWSRFAAILRAENQRQLYLAADALPNGTLLTEALAIKQRLSPGLIADRRSSKHKQKVATSSAAKTKPATSGTTQTGHTAKGDKPTGQQVPKVKPSEAIPTVQPTKPMAKVANKPLVLDPSTFHMQRNTTIPKATNAISFKLERVAGSHAVRIRIVKQVDKTVEELSNTIALDTETTIPVLPGARVRVDSNGTVHLTGNWPWQFNYKFEFEGDCYIDELNNTGDIDISARRLRVSKPIQTKRLKLRATEELAVPEITTNQALTIVYEGDAEHYHCGKVLSRGTVDIETPNCDLELTSTIDAIGTVDINGQRVTNRANITSLRGQVNLTSTSADAYSIANHGSIGAEQGVTFAGVGLLQQGQLATNGDIRFNVQNLSLQHQVEAGGNIHCSIPGEFIQSEQASLRAGGEVLFQVPHSVQTNAAIEANGRVRVIVEGPAATTFETRAPLISHSPEGMEVTATRVINSGRWVTTHGGMRVRASIAADELASVNRGEIACAGNFIIDTAAFSLEAGSFKTNGNFVVNSASLQLAIMAPCEVVGNLQVHNIRADQFSYAADIIRVNGILDLHFLQAVTLGQAINTPGGMLISSGGLLTLAAPIKINGKASFTVPEIATTSTLEARSDIDITTSSSVRKGYTITNTGVIKTTEGHITINGQGLSHTNGTIASNNDLVVRVQNANLLKQCTAGKRLVIEATEPGAFVYTEDSFSAGSLEIIRSNGFPITVPLYNPGGAISLIVQPDATADVQVLAPIKTSEDSNGDVRIITPTKLIVGQTDVLQEISAGGRLHFEAGVIDNSWGKLFGNARVYLKSAGKIISGAAIVTQKTCSLVPGYPYTYEFNELNGALIASGGDLQVAGIDLDNSYGEIYVAGNLDTESLTYHIVNLGGIINCQGNADFTRNIVANGMEFHDGFSVDHPYNPPRPYYGYLNLSHGISVYNQAKSRAGTIQIGGNAVFGILYNYAGQIAVAGAMPPLDSQKVTDVVRLNYYRAYKRFLKDGHQSFSCDVDTVMETHQGAISSGKSITITPKALTLAGIMSSPQIAITGFSTAIVGLVDASLLLPTKPFQQVHPLIDYARPSGMYQPAAPSESSTVMRLTIPINYTPALPTVTVIHPHGFSGNHKNLRLMFPPMAEKQYITEILMQALGRGYLDEQCTTAEQIHYKLRLEAYNVRKHYPECSGDSPAGATELMQRPAIPHVNGPMLVYQELEYEGPHGRETVLSPVVWFPKSYDNAYVRSGMGLVYGNQVYILGNLEESSTLYIGGCIQATKTLTAACRDNFTLSGVVEGETTDLASFEGNMEIVSRVTRVQRNHGGYDDVVSRARAKARETLVIAAPRKDVIFQGADTQSGVKTEVQAGGQILDIPIPEAHQSIQHVDGGTITDTDITQRTSSHTSDNGSTTGKVTTTANGAVTLYAPEFSAHTAEITSATAAPAILDVHDVHQHEEHISSKSGGLFSRRKTTDSVSVSQTSKGAQFNVQESTVAGKTGVRVRHMHSTAKVNKFKAPGQTVSIEQGENQHSASSSTSRSSWAWQRASSDESSHVTYSSSTFTGRIEIDASELHLEQVRDTTLEFMKRIIQGDASIRHTILEEQHHHESHCSEGPSAGLAVLAAIVVSTLTAGTGSSLIAGLGESFAKETLLNSIFAAGFSSACAQASVALLANKGDPGKAIKFLGSHDSVRTLATSMLSAGIMDKICARLKLPAAFKHKTPGEHLQYNLARASVSAVLNMSINGQDADKAILSGLADAAVSTAAGITAQHIGDMYLGQKMSSVTHKVTHMAVGAASGAVLGGKKGALAGAIGAGVAEVVAEALQPELPLEALNAQLKSAETEKGRTLTFEEYQAVKARAMSTESLREHQQEVTKTANYAKISAATASLLAHQDVGVAAQTASTALENNFMVSSIAAIALAQTEYFDYLEEARLQKTVEDGLVDIGSSDEASIGLPSGTRAEYAEELPDVELGELPSEPLRSQSPTPGAVVRIRTSSLETSAANPLIKGRMWQRPDGTLVFACKYGIPGSRNVTTFYGRMPQSAQQPTSQYSAMQWLKLAYRAATGDRSTEVLSWQQNNRDSMPMAAATTDYVASRALTPTELAKVSAPGIREGVVFLGTFLGEEAARFRLGRQTLTGRAINTAGTFVGEEFARLRLGEQTTTGGFVRFLGEDAARYSLGEPTFVGQRVEQAMVGFNNTPMQDIMRGITRETTQAMLVGEVLVGAGAAVRIAGPRVVELSGQFAGRAVTVAREFSPITFQFTFQFDTAKAATLYSGFPVDSVKFRVPPALRRSGILDPTVRPNASWGAKDILSVKDLTSPVSLTAHETQAVSEWMLARKMILDKWERQSLKHVNPRMADKLDAVHSQLRDHMTPGDLAGILKESKGIEILRRDGVPYSHLRKEWKQVQRSLENAIQGPWTGNIEEATILRERLSEISRLWDSYENLINRGPICQPTPKK